MEIDTNPSEYQEFELRPLNCRLDAHTRSDGSAMLSQGMSNENDVVQLQRIVNCNENCNVINFYNY